ncbi:MAG: NAD(P)-dependent oxidoreductase [Mycobacteriales bacterium]
MKLVVFGATGRTGRHVVAQALDAGHDVVAVARRPADLAVRHDRLQIVQGDVLDPATVGKPVAGSDAVVLTVGVPHRRPTLVFSDGAGNVIEAMRDAGVRRILCTGSAYVDANGPGLRVGQRVYTKLILQRRYRNTYNDMERMELELQLSGLDWTAVRPVQLVDGERTGNYRHAVGRHVGRPGVLRRADLADFLVGHLDDPATFRTWAELSS